MKHARAVNGAVRQGLRLHNLITPNVDGHRTIGSEEPSAPSASAALLQSTRGATVLSTEPSTEPLSGQDASAAGQDARCSACNAPIAPDQRYCLQCGERLAPISGFLLGRHGTAAGGSTAEPAPTPPGVPPFGEGTKAPQSTLLGVLAGVGVLLLAMGVGVLIGRAGNSKPVPAREQVVTQPAPGSGTGAGTAEASFTSDWPASRSGYTVELSTLPSSSTDATVQAAKTAATAKGAPAVGALDSGEFSTLPSGHYLIYSGDYQTSARANSALKSLRGKFPAATVVHVSSSGSGAGSSAGGSGASAPHLNSSLSHPAPPSVLKTLKGKGKSYTEASKNLPNVVETG